MNTRLPHFFPVTGKKFIKLLSFACFFQAWMHNGQVAAQDCNCDYTIPESVVYVDGSKVKLPAGGTVCIKASQKRYLKLVNFRGAPDKYIKFVNCGGQVVLNNNDHAYGISLENCQYFRFTGTGTPQIAYGFKITGTGKDASGITIGTQSSDFEIDHLEISNVGFAGILTKTDPKCDNMGTRDNFVQRNTVIHDNYVHDTHGEGIYVGSSFYSGYNINCNGAFKRVLPHTITGLRIYKNRIQNTGWDGIQVGCAEEDCEIYDNVISKYGQEGIIGQMSGIQINSGTSGKCYSNLVLDGKGEGIFMAGLGDNICYNNVIINAGRTFFPGDLSDAKEVYGIFCDDRDPIPGKSFHFIHNTIINPKSEGIRMLSVLSGDNKIMNNLIVNPGSYTRYENDNTSATGQDAFINVRRKNLKVNLAGNVFVVDPGKAGFADLQKGDFNLLDESPAIDKGTDISAMKINFDINKRLRPYGKQADPGAYEYYPVPVTGEEEEKLSAAIRLYPNPVVESLSFEIDYPGAALAQYQVKDVTGRVMSQVSGENIKHAGNRVDVSSLAPGVYFLEFELNGRSVVKKFAKH